MRAGLEQRHEFPQHALVLRQMLDHAHDDDGVVFSVGLVGQQVGIDQLPIVAELAGASVQIVDRDLRDGDAGAFDAAAEAYSNQAPQPGPISRIWSPGLSPSFSIAVVELPQRATSSVSSASA